MHDSDEPAPNGGVLELPPSSRRIVRISPRDNPLEYWCTCWDYREVLWFLARRDLVVRYRQTLAGILWLLLRPASQVVIFTVIYGYLARFPTDGLPYPVLALSGVVAWTFFASIVNQSTIALTNNANLITKVHFPRILLPVGTIAPNLVDLVINLVALFVVMAFYGWIPSWRVLLVPVPLILVALTALGLGLWLSAGCVKYRDFRQLAPFILQVLYMFSPVGFSSTLVRDRFSDVWLALFYCNPMAAAIDLFRWCTHPGGFGPVQHLSQLVLSLVSGVLLVASGTWFFRTHERTFADVI